MRVMEQTGLTETELALLPLNDYSRVVHGQTPAQAALAAYNRQQDASGTAASAAPAAPEPPTVPDFANMSAAEYAAYREQSGIAPRSAEGMQRASLSMQDRWVRQADFGPAGRKTFGRWAD
jgi:hypothetical protein